ncbi:MAG: bifunctional folylpolyglutamate synthase/dihydrofolate synthase [Raoultibacter sp.]|jgi:dihydrofolate synthase/folylpolyglutamate synthase
MKFDPIAYINEPRWHTSRLGLERITELLGKMGNPQNSFKSIHVAGTNGKGSTSSFVASILQSTHYTTGLFTSPGISADYDRIRVDGANITFDELLDVTLYVKEIADAMEDHPTEFELMSAIAFEHFKRSNCDFAVIEVGMGGRLDSTNVLEKPEVSVITPISRDHTEYLGETLEQIAREKAGIIKDGVPVVSWPLSGEIESVIKEVAAQHNSALTEPDFSQLTIHARNNDNDLSQRTLVFDYKTYHELEIGLIGSYQPYNAALAIEAIEVLRRQGHAISDDALREGLRTTQWPARFELVSTKPVFVIDGGHNLQGVKAFAGSLKLNFPDQKFIFITGILRDKDYAEMLDEVLPLGVSFIAITTPNPRSLSAQEMATAIHDSAQRTLDKPESIEVFIAPSIQDAVDKAFDLAGNTGVICSFGSLYSVAEVKAALAER